MNESKYLNRALLILAAYDYEALQITLNTLNNTIDHAENVVVLLNGKSNFDSENVERVARDWANARKNCHVVRPLCKGSDAFLGIQEILTSFKPLEHVNFICKIDDDVIPLKHGWIDELETTYNELKNKGENPFFVTGLINNNAWGFKKIIDIFEKQEEYLKISNYASNSGTGIVQGGEIADGFCGTIWQYPYISFWTHQWTSLNISEFVKKTSNLEICRIPSDVHFSIGCIYFSKNDWLKLEPSIEKTNFDELLIHKYCIKYQKSKWSVLSQPMIHLFYHNQRIPNRVILPEIEKNIRNYFNDPAIKIKSHSIDEKLQLVTSMIYEMKSILDFLIKEQEKSKSSNLTRLIKYIIFLFKKNRKI